MFVCIVWCGVVCVVIVIDNTACLSRRVPKCTSFGWKKTWEQAPGVPATRGALDNEELFVIEGSKKDPGAQLQKTGGARKMPHFTAKKTITDVIIAAC